MVEPASVFAQQAAADAASTGLEPITVNGYRFLDADTSGITNLPLSIEKVPQSISLVNNDFAKAADLRNMGEVAQYTPGAMWASFSPSYGNQFWLRGFSANFAVDGVPVGDQITDPDPAILERYEIVKGPASVVYGAQSPGGVVNLVSKGAAADTPNYLEVLGGSWGRLRIEGQTAGSLNDANSVRAIAVAAHEENGSFVDFVKLSRTVVYAGFDFDVSRDLTAYLRTSYQRTEDTPYNGIPTYADGTLVPVSRSFLLGGSNLDAIAQATRLDAGLNWRMSDLWSLSLKSIYQFTTHEGQNSYPYSTIGTDGSFPFGGEDFKNWHVNDATVAASAVRKLDDIGLKESSISADIRYQRYRYYIFETGLTGGTANMNAGDGAVSSLFNAQTPTAGDYEQDQRMNYVTASSQAIIKLAEPLTLVGGVAYSKPMIDLQVYGGGFQSLNPGAQTNYRAAAVYEPVQSLNLYASYSESYAPNLRIDTSYKVLPPVSGKQVELGAKYLPNNRLLLTAALFDIRESNVAVYDTTVNGEALYRTSNVRHRGFEFETTGRLADRWQIKGGLALLDPKVTQDPNNPVNNGETRPWLPKLTATAYSDYRFLNGYSISGGLRYVGSVKTYDNSSSVQTPDIASYLLFDAGAGYEVDRHWRIQLNLKNLFDKRYAVPTPVFQSLAAGLYPGEPRSVALTARREF